MSHTRIISTLAFVGIIFWPGIIREQIIVETEDQFLSNKGGVTAAAEIIQKSVTKESPYIPILMYHYIRDLKDLPLEDSIGRSLSVSQEKLTEHLKDIKQLGLKSYTLSDLASRKVTTKGIILTFDDGYKDFYTNAWPILKKYRIKATVFIISNKIGKTGYLSADQIQELSSAGIEIGSHTVSHPNLTNVSDSNLKMQLTKSKLDLETIIGGRIVSLAYPSGHFNDLVIDQLIEADYLAAVTTVENIATVKQSEKSIFALSRIRMREKSDLEKILTNYRF